MKRLFILAFALCIMMFSAGIALLVVSSHYGDHVEYKGDVYLMDSTYEDFKSYIWWPNVKIKSFVSVFQESGAKVQYELIVPKSWDFPFAYDDAIPLRNPDCVGAGVICTTMGVGFSAFTGGMVSTMKEVTE